MLWITCFERSCIDNKSWTTQHLQDVLIVVDCRLSNICANWKMGAFSLKVISQNILIIFCAKTLQTYVETFALNYAISTIFDQWVELDLCSIKVWCHLFNSVVWIETIGAAWANMSSNNSQDNWSASWDFYIWHSVKWMLNIKTNTV